MEEVKAYKTKDNTLFLNEKDAKDHETEYSINMWLGMNISTEEIQNPKAYLCRIIRKYVDFISKGE